VQKTEESQAIAAKGSSEDKVRVSNGWFSVNTPPGSLEGMFGIRSIYYVPQPDMLKYEVIGNNLDYEITFYFKEKTYTERGKTSSTAKAIPEVDLGNPSDQNVKITITITYKGKQYTDTFYKYLKR